MQAAGKKGGGAQGRNAATNAVPSVKFKDLTLNEEFYFVSDTKKNFLKLKVPAENAKTVSTGEVLGPVPGESLVVNKGGASTAAKPKTQ